jgi:hypothetical protein
MTIQNIIQSKRKFYSLPADLQASALGQGERRNEGIFHINNVLLLQKPMREIGE